MVALRQLIEQGVSYAEVQERATHDVQLEQELIWMKLKGLEPTNDLLPRMDLWPGHFEYKGSRKSYHHGSAHSTAHRSRKIEGSRRLYRPWRELNECWPNHRSVVEVQLRGRDHKAEKIPTAYHIDKTWYDAQTGKPIKSTVERWRVSS